MLRCRHLVALAMRQHGNYAISPDVDGLAPVLVSTRMRRLCLLGCHSFVPCGKFDGVWECRIPSRLVQVYFCTALLFKSSILRGYQAIPGVRRAASWRS